MNFIVMVSFYWYADPDVCQQAPGRAGKIRQPAHLPSWGLENVPGRKKGWHGR